MVSFKQPGPGFQSKKFQTESAVFVSLMHSILSEALPLVSILSFLNRCLLLTHSYLETHKMVIDKQCRPRSDAT